VLYPREPDENCFRRPVADERLTDGCGLRCTEYYASRRASADLQVALLDESGAAAIARSAANPTLIRVDGPDSGWHLERDLFRPQDDQFSCQSIAHWTTISIPLDAFLGDNPAFDPSRVAAVQVEATLVGDAATDAQAYIAFDSFEVVHVPLLCNDGIVDRGESCEDGIPSELFCEDVSGSGTGSGDLGCTPQCRLDVTQCGACEPGDNGCECLQLDGDEPEGISMERSVFGDGRYCHDDVVLGGRTRCVELTGGAGDRCLTLANGQGPWSPCFPSDGCGSSRFEVDGVAEVATITDTMRCSFGRLQREGQEPDLSPALGIGYCFVDDTPALDGGRPDWFLDAYCQARDPGLEGETTPENGDLCVGA